MIISRCIPWLLLAAVLTGCAPKVGSEAWCKAMDAKAKGDWTAHEATAYAKHCLLGIQPKD